MDWSSAGKRTKLGIFDGSVLVPIMLSFVVFHWITIGFLICYASVNAYLLFKGRSMTWVIRKARYWLRDGLILARTISYWRDVL